MEMTKTKAIVAAIGAFVEALKVLLVDNILEANEFVSLISSVVILITTVVMVFRIPNERISPSSSE